MRRWLLLQGFVLTCSMLSSGCTELLLEGTDYHRGPGPETDNGLVCNEGFTACSNECVRVESDSRHCGVCGHDCFGAACDAGMCATQEVVSSIDEPRGLAVDDTHVYWTTAGGDIQRAPKEGGAIEQIASGQGDSLAIAIEGQHAFWINPDAATVMRAKKDGTGGDPHAIFKGTGGDILRGLALDDMTAYFNRTKPQGDVRHANKMGSDGDKPATFFQQPSPADIQLLGSYVVWSGYDDLTGPQRGNGARGAEGGYVRCAPQQGAKEENIVTLADGEGEIIALASTGDMAVWADGDSGTIEASGLTGGAPITLAEDQDVIGLAADAVRVFWSTENGNVKSHVLTTHETRVLAFDIDSIGAVVTDNTHVYILRTGHDGGILRVAK